MCRTDSFEQQSISGGSNICNLPGKRAGKTEVKKVTLCNMFSGNNIEH